MLAPSSAITGSPFVLDSSAVLKLISSVSSYFFLLICSDFQRVWIWMKSHSFCWSKTNPTVSWLRRVPDLYVSGLQLDPGNWENHWTTSNLQKRSYRFWMSHNNHTSWRHWTDGSYGESSPFMAKNLDYFRVSDALLKFSQIGICWDWNPKQIMETYRLTYSWIVIR